MFFTQSLHTGTLPSDWTKAYISPVFKKNNRHLTENYRPVSLTSICCKVMVHIHVIVKHIANHVDKYSILTQFQHGFRQARSRETQLMTTLHDMMYHWDINVQLDLAFLDFSKAFDTVAHNRLLGKLHHYGIDGNIHHWLSSFLKNRSQSVVVDGVSSAQVKVESGVPRAQFWGRCCFCCTLMTSQTVSLPESGGSPTIACCIVPFMRHPTNMPYRKISTRLLFGVIARVCHLMQQNVKSCESQGRKQSCRKYIPSKDKLCKKSTKPDTLE